MCKKHNIKIMPQQLIFIFIKNVIYSLDASNIFYL